MARNERPQWARLDVDGTVLLADLASGSSLARPIEFEGPQLRCFGAEAASSTALVVGQFNGRVSHGASCNCSTIRLTPHANGTHTESAGHLTVEALDAHRVVPRRLLIAALMSIDPELAGDSDESTIPMPQSDDLMITRAALERAWPKAPVPRLLARAAVVRTLPNHRVKFAEDSWQRAPYLSRDAALWLVERGIEHLLLDVPSADRANDGGELTAHHIFFGLPRGITTLAQAQRRDCTITELAYIDDAVSDGWYFLSLQTPAIAGDAVPSRPLLYPLRDMSGGRRKKDVPALPDLPQAAAQDFNAQLGWAQARDAVDPLAALRGGFVLPRGGDGRPVRYLCGHSLGLAPLAARAMIEAEIMDWERLGVRGHEHADTPWIGYTERLRPALATLAGAHADEVVAMNSLSVNLHLLMASFYRPTARRAAILIEQGAFSSDRHAVAAQIAWHGHDPAQQLIELAPRPGEDLLRIEDIEARIAAESERIALVLWPGVQYLTGQNFDLRRIAAATHAHGATVGFDLAHAIGNVPLSLHAHDADFAVWCSYKYLNAGPGAIGGAFVHQRHAERSHLPRLAGWWGNDEATRFQMRTHFEPAAGAAAWAVSNPPIFSTAALRASLPLFAQAGAAALHAKSRALSGYLQWLVEQLVGDAASLISPRDPTQRGCQLSFRIRSAISGESLLQTLAARGVIADWRQPDVLRLAPTPLYNRFEDVLHAARALADTLRA